jgi:hypothetical protein
LKRSGAFRLLLAMMIALLFAAQGRGQTSGKSEAECRKADPGSWGPNFGDEWHAHEAVYWGCRLGVPAETVRAWQDPYGMIVDIQKATIENAELIFAEHMEGTLRCYGFRVFRKTAETWRQVWEDVRDEYCMASCPPIKMTISGSHLLLESATTPDAKCKTKFAPRNFAWDGKTFAPSAEGPSAESGGSPRVGSAVKAGTNSKKETGRSTVGASARGLCGGG